MASAGVRKKKGLDMINPNAAGIDMHSETHVACAPSDKYGIHPVKTFETYTKDLIDMAKWLKVPFGVCPQRVFLTMKIILQKVP